MHDQGWRLVTGLSHLSAQIWASTAPRRARRCMTVISIENETNYTQRSTRMVAGWTAA